MDRRGLEPLAFRMRSGCATIALPALYESKWGERIFKWWRETEPRKAGLYAHAGWLLSPMDERESIREMVDLKSKIRDLQQQIAIRDNEYNNFMRHAPWGIFLARGSSSNDPVSNCHVYYANPTLIQMLNTLDLNNQPILPSEFWQVKEERSAFMNQLSVNGLVNGATVQMRDARNHSFWAKIFARVIKSPDALVVYGCVVDVSAEKIPSGKTSL